MTKCYLKSAKKTASKPCLYPNTFNKSIIMIYILALSGRISREIAYIRHSPVRVMSKKLQLWLECRVVTTKEIKIIMNH